MDEMVGWHHQFNGHEFEQTPGLGEGQGRLAGCSPQGHKASELTEQLNNDNQVTLPELVGSKLPSGISCNSHPSVANKGF